MAIVNVQDVIKLRDAVSFWYKKAEDEINGDMSNEHYVRATSPYFKTNVAGVPTVNDIQMLKHSLEEAGFVGVAINVTVHDGVDIRYSLPLRVL